VPWVVLSIYSWSATVHFLRFLWGRKCEVNTAFACYHIYYLLPHALFINLHKNFLLQVASVLVDRVLIKLDIQALVVVLMLGLLTGRVGIGFLRRVLRWGLHGSGANGS
jgi:hypothetical protein